MKSNVSDLELAQAVYLDACAKCSALNSDLRDLQTMRSRVKREGISFLTITLPAFCKDFERSLDAGFIDPAYFQGFRKYGAIPAFLQGMLGLLFDRETGRFHEEVPLEAAVIVDSIRQVCLLHKKVQLSCTPEREAAAVENFVTIEQSNNAFQLPQEQAEKFAAVANVLWANLLGDIRLDELVPRHGPGATAERISGNQKYSWSKWYERLEPSFPYWGTGVSVSAYGEEDVPLVTFVSEQDEDPVRVTLVPKTLKTPRVIAIEPVCMQYVQQAIQSTLVEKIESYWLTSGHVNFTDQSINQKLALTSSSTGQMATIDLSDASDRVLHGLALSMFDGNTDLRDAVDACRSRTALLPDGRVIGPLSKFASMGSALCFPVESMYFYTICVAALLTKYDLPVTPRNVFSVSRNVYVYGDDIVVPSHDADTVLDHLQKYHCKVNASKTFYTGKFRESCGVDAYDGELVTPVYLRHPRPENRREAQQLISWVSTANLFYKKGYWRTATLMFNECEKHLGPLPYVSEESSALGRVSLLGYRTAERWNPEFQAFQVRAWVPSTVYSSDHIGGYAALQKCLLTLEGRSSFETEGTSAFLDHTPWFAPVEVAEDHLEQSARRGAVSLKRRWVPST